MFASVVIAVCAGFLVQLALTHRARVQALAKRQCRRPRELSAHPTVTVIRPVKGTDVEQEQNFRAALDTGYRGEIETIFVFEDEHDPGVAIARSVIAEHAQSSGHGAARIIFAGSPPPGRTGKINNMIAGEDEAKGEFIVFGDSDSRPDREVLSNLIEHLVQDDKVGASFAPAVTPSRPLTAGDVGHNIILNAYLVANMEGAVGPSGENAFLMGQMMAFRASALEAIGGVKCADGQLVDDMFLGARIVEAGYRNILGTHPLHIISYGLGFMEFMRLWRRWLFCGRGGVPLRFVWQFVIRAVSYFAGIGLAVAALIIDPVLAVAPAVLVLCEGLHYVRLHRLHGGAPIPLRFMWMVWVPFASVIPIGLTMLFAPELSWRGHTYRVDLGAKLRPGNESAAGLKDQELR